MADLECTGLRGTNPLGFLAALGALVVLGRDASTPPRLSWSGDVVPHARLHDVHTIEATVDAVLADRDRWADSPALDFSPDGASLDDVKVDRETLRDWLRTCHAAVPSDGGRALSLVTALVDEASVDRKDQAKPTDLHFTAGQQKFLLMARTLREGLTAGHVHEALTGPWRYESTLPSFKWDVTDDRVYAYGATDPSKDTKRTVPGAEWLALQGLTLLPVAGRPNRTMTPGCAGGWRRGSFSWPIWRPAISADVVRVLLSSPDLVRDPPAASLLHRGVAAVYRSTIVRSDQGGYGSFRPPRVVLDTPDAH